MSWSRLFESRGFLLVLTAAWALAYLPNLGTRTLRLEEGRRATPAREMLAASDYVRPTLYGDTYLSKPPLFYWLVAIVGSLLGEVNPIATRIPSVIAALGCALVAYRFAPESLDRKTRALAALFVLSSATMLEKGTLGEIDATLCFLVGLILKVWWDGNGPEGQSSWSWAQVGLLLGMTGLLKGPAGPAIFYLTIGPYLIWAGRWRRLVSFGHLVCVLLAAMPAAAWVAMLLKHGVIPASDLVALWFVQLGTDHAAEAIADPSGQMAHLLRHYFEFPVLVAGRFFPAVLWLPFALRRRWVVEREVPNNVWRFLVCAVLGPLVVIYLYPESRPRHVMPVNFAAAMLASVVVSAMARLPGRWAVRNHATAMVLAWAPAILAASGVVLALIVHAPGLPAAVAALIAGIVWSWATFRVTRNTPRESGAIALAVTITGVTLAVWFVVNTVVVPWRAPFVISQDAVAVSERLPPGEVVYTTRTFPVTAEGYYNLQFHLARELRAVSDLDALKRAAPCVAVVTPADREHLESAGCIVEEIGRMGGGRGAPPEVHVIRVK